MVDPAGQPAPGAPHLLIPCPTWQSPLLDIVDGGIEVKCPRCGKKHRIGRAFLEQIWEALSAGREPFAEQPGA